MYEQDDGWAEWVHPEPGYRLQCCGCGLVHDMEFGFGNVAEGTPLHPGETIKRAIIFRARRVPPSN